MVRLHIGLEDPKDLINDLKSDSTLEIKERCLLGWIAVRHFSEFENPGPPYNFCSDFSEEQLSLFQEWLKDGNKPTLSRPEPEASGLEA